jgi:hypothetical protein
MPANRIQEKICTSKHESLSLFVLRQHPPGVSIIVPAHDKRMVHHQPNDLSEQRNILHPQHYILAVTHPLPRLETAGQEGSEQT